MQGDSAPCGTTDRNVAAPLLLTHAGSPFCIAFLCVLCILWFFSTLAVLFAVLLLVYFVYFVVSLLLALLFPCGPCFPWTLPSHAVLFAVSISISEPEFW